MALFLGLMPTYTTEVPCYLAENEAAPVAASGNQIVASARIWFSRRFVDFGYQCSDEETADLPGELHLAFGTIAPLGKSQVFLQIALF